MYIPERLNEMLWLGEVAQKIKHKTNREVLGVYTPQEDGDLEKIQIRYVQADCLSYGLGSLAVLPATVYKTLLREEIYSFAARCWKYKY